MKDLRLEQQHPVTSLELVSNTGEDLYDSSSSKDETVFIAMILSGIHKTDNFIKLYTVFEEEFLLFLSLFTQQTIKIPPAKTLDHYKSYAKIYIFLNRRGFSDEAFEEAARLFSKRVTHVRAIIAKVDRLFIEFRTIVENNKNLEGYSKIAEVLHEFRSESRAGESENSGDKSR